MKTLSDSQEIMINTRELPNCVAVAEVAGEIDVRTFAELRSVLSRLIEKTRHKIIVNLEKVEFIDSCGLGVLVGGLRETKEREGKMHLVCTNRRVLEIFNITGFSRIFSIFKSEEEALSGP